LFFKMDPQVLPCGAILTNTSFLDSNSEIRLP
jgi:hypothetical protein